MMNFLKIMALTVTMPTLNAIDFNEIMKTIASSVSVLILAVAVIYGGWSLYEGFSDDSPAAKKKGFIALLGGVIAAGLMYVLLTAIFGITW